MNELAIDIGNTDLVLGFWPNQSKDPHTQRLKVKKIVENKSILNSFLNASLSEFGIKNITSITLCSVVPILTPIVSVEVKKICSTELVILDKENYHYLPIGILKPNEIGTDLVANALAAHIFYKTSSIIIDFGTAMSFTTIDENGKIIGVAIAPGLQTAIKTLTHNAAQLFDVPIVQPNSALGLDTKHAIQAGITFGYDGMVRGIINAQEKEIGKKLNVIFTGGLSKIVHSLKDRVDHYQPYLTLEGIRLAGNFITR
ncbi:MAG: type III pantothenate kinase [Saprospiraceae bacterium]